MRRTAIDTALALPVCGKCNAPIQPADINVGTDLAYCRTCNVPHTLSTLVRSVKLDGAPEIERPPRRTWYRRSAIETVMGASHFSPGSAIGLLAISLFWNGILSIFVMFAISGTVANLGGPAPSWFPAPKMNGGPMSLGLTIFLWLFLTPFLLVGFAMLSAFVSTLLGRTEIRLRDPEAVIFSGIASLGRRQRFLLADVSEVRLLDQSWRDSDGDRRRSTVIVVELKSGKPLKFGSMLSDERKRFLAAALRNSTR